MMVFGHMHDILGGKETNAMLRIGIIGCGNIAGTLAATMLQMPDRVKIEAVASRSVEKAGDFAARFGVDKAYGSYEELYDDEDVDLVYVATPHAFHCAQMLDALERGKHILCEKAFCINAQEAEKVFALAARKHLYVAEAIWTRYMPSRKIINDIISSGRIGRVTTISANLGYKISQKDRIADPALGGGALLASFASYTVEKKLAGEKADPPFGTGNIRGVAGPESANNAGAQTSFIPMLTLGIPSNAVMALMIGAMMIHDIVPGPQVMTSDPELFWGFIVAMWLGNLFLIILNLPMIGVWIQLLKVPYRMLYPAILVFCCIGVFSINNNVWDVWVTVFFGAVGYLFSKLGCEPAPLVLGFILGPMMEENLRRALLLSRGDPMTFITSPISCGFLIASVVLIALVAAPALRKTREKAFRED